MEGNRKIPNQSVSLTKTPYKPAMQCQGGRKKGESPKRRNLRSTCRDTAFFLKESLLATVCRKDVWVFLFICLLVFFQNFLRS